MEQDKFRRRVELKGELSKLDAKRDELARLAAMEYFADFRIEGRALHHRDYDDEIAPSVKDSLVGGVGQTCFQGSCFALWNDLCRGFIRDMAALIEVQRLEILARLDELP